MHGQCRDDASLVLSEHCSLSHPLYPSVYFDHIRPIFQSHSRMHAFADAYMHTCTLPPTHWDIHMHTHTHMHARTPTHTHLGQTSFHPSPLRPPSACQLCVRAEFLGASKSASCASGRWSVQPFVQVGGVKGRSRDTALDEVSGGELRHDKGTDAF